MTKAKNQESQFDDHDMVDNQEEKNWLVPGLFAITINPNDGNQFNGEPNRCKRVRAALFDILLDFKETVFTLETELSYPNSKGFSLSNKLYKYPRVHFHGILELTTPGAVKHFLEYGLYALAAYHVNVTDFKRLEDGTPDYAGWVNYCTKQNLIMNEKTMVMDHKLKPQRRGPRSIKQQLLYGPTSSESDND